MVVPTAVAEPVFRSSVVPGVKSAKLSMVTLKVTVNDPPTGRVPMIAPPSSSGKAVAGVALSGLASRR